MTISTTPAEICIRGGYGGAFTNYATDRLEPEIFDHLSTSNPEKPSGLFHAADLGCGHGGLAVRMARLGTHIRVHAVDRLKSCLDETDVLSQINGVNQRVWSYQQSIPEFARKAGSPLHTVVMMRSLLFLKPDDARESLLNLSRRTLPHGRLFLVTAGLESPLAEAPYPAETPLEQRFARPGNLAGAVTNIKARVTLYTADELRELVGSTHWKVVHFRTGDWGHHKLIAKPC